MGSCSGKPYIQERETWVYRNSQDKWGGVQASEEQPKTRATAQKLSINNLPLTDLHKDTIRKANCNIQIMIQLY